VTIVAGIDSSTQSCTVVLYDLDTGALLAQASAPHPPTTPPVSEQDPAEWQRALGLALSSVCGLAGCSSKDIAALSVAAQHHGLVALDARHQVLRPAKLWNDTCSAPQAAALVAMMGHRFWVDRVGSVPSAAFTITKLAWLAENEPECLRRLDLVLLPHDWLTLKLCGEPVSDRGDSSGTGYFDAVADQWCTDVLTLVDKHRAWEDHLPSVLGPDAAAGTADTAWARELGLSPHAVVAVGTGDQTAAALGLGLGEGDVMVSIGTSGVVTGISAAPVTDPKGGVDCIASATGGFQPSVVTLNAAKVTDAFARWLGTDLDGLSGLALEADPRSPHRPILAPYLDGERSPNRPHARGLLAYLSSSTSREELALSAYEGVALGLLSGLHTLVERGLNTHSRLLVTGGASRSAAYRQVLGSVFGRAVYATAVDGGIVSARGAAIQAAAVARGESVQKVASAWAPQTEVVANPAPGSGETTASLIARYAAVTAVDELDGGPSAEVAP
jgi:xylulokinase